MDVGGGARIGIARGMCLSGMGASLERTASCPSFKSRSWTYCTCIPYSYKQASTASLMSECRMASEAIVNWRNYVRDIFAEHFIRNPLWIGGPGHSVEIDESAFERGKANVDRMVNTQWVFGGIDVETKHSFLVAVPQRDAAMLLPIPQQYILRRPFRTSGTPTTRLATLVTSTCL